MKASDKLSVDALSLPELVREGLDCFDCRQPLTSVSVPVGFVYTRGLRQGWQVFSCCRPINQ